MDLYEVSPPFISSAPGLANLRDVGGYPITDHSSVRKGLVYRGPDPAPVSAASLETLRLLGITTLFDLRSQQQIDRAGGHRDFEDIHRIWTPVFGPEEYTPEKAALRYAQYSAPGSKDIVDAFTDILESGTQTFRSILLHIASLPPPTSEFPAPSLLMHCTTGNNRTGVFVGMLLALLSVPDSYIAEEYALSQVGLAPSRSAAVARLMKSPVFAGEGGKERCERMVGARSESMSAMLGMVRSKYGGAEGYVTNLCKLSFEEIDKVREVLTVRS